MTCEGIVSPSNKSCTVVVFPNRRASTTFTPEKQRERSLPSEMVVATSRMTPARVLGGRGRNALTGTPQIVVVASRACTAETALASTAITFFRTFTRASTTWPIAMESSSSESTCLLILRTLPPDVEGVKSTVRDAGTTTLMLW